MCHPGAPSGIILLIIAVPGVQQAHVDPRPLHRVHGPLGEAGKARGAHGVVGNAALDLAHPAPEPDCVGGYVCLGFATASFRNVIGEDHRTLFPLVEFKCPEIHPHSASHLLVHGKGGAAAHVGDGVICRFSAVGEGFIGNIYGVKTPFGYVRGPFDLGGRGAVPGRRGHPAGSHPERVVVA